MKVAGRSENVEALLIRLGEPLLAFKHPGVDRRNTRVVLARVVDHVRVSKRSLGVEQVVGSRGKRDPFAVRHELSHVDTKLAPSLLNRGGHPRLPLVEGRPCGLDGAHNAFLEMGRVLLHDDDGLL